MNVTRTAVANTFNVSLDKVKQIGAKQLFIVDCPNKGRVLVSYKIIVGRFDGIQWFLTTERYSVTTSKQLTKFKNSTSFPCLYTDNLWSENHANN